ncbi:guanine deaminase [Aureimonas fodinaquatilis]|uniref:Guanine deaminase n=1 Tax=Aureimonas fodinaquatilis TaxID=2565783 RepID=A0A5B0DQ94_9HYPH|nr:guanine deaminase [Aureimonas fodinaquatilis]KAA0968638.1 guanine deaminase [Aureimonas fodinaquatilis]
MKNELGNEEQILRGRVLSFDGNPAVDAANIRYFEDGLIHLKDGLVVAVGEASTLLPAISQGLRVTDHRPHLIMAGFVDPHLHMPQTQVIGSYGTELMEWLSRYTFPEESRYADKTVCDTAAGFLLDQLAANGTTTAAAYCTSHPQSAESLFEESGKRGLRMVAGKVMMDRNAPAGLLDTPQRAYDESKALIQRFNGLDRLTYAITPRFAPTSTEAQLEVAGVLAREHPDLPIQTHLSESLAEIDFVKDLFGWSRDYLDVYERYGLVRRGALFGHCIHLTMRERETLAQLQGSAIFCPTSNLFLGSGLFDRAGLQASGVITGIATDIGGGTSYSMLVTAAEGYKVLALRGERMTAFEAFYWMSAGNAYAMALDERIGRIAPGYEADLVVLDLAATPAMRHRMERAESLADQLFALLIMGDDRAVVATYAMGRKIYDRKGTATLPPRHEAPITAVSAGWQSQQ